MDNPRRIICELDVLPGDLIAWPLDPNFINKHDVDYMAMIISIGPIKNTSGGPQTRNVFSIPVGDRCRQIMWADEICLLVSRPK